MRTDYFRFRRFRKGQIFSIDTLLSFGIFLIIVTLSFFIWNYSITKINSVEEKEEIDTVAYVLSEAVLSQNINSSLSFLSSVNNSFCKSYGMYKMTMNCFLDVYLENGSNYHFGSANNETSYTATEMRAQIIDGRFAIIKVGVIDE